MATRSSLNLLVIAHAGELDPLANAEASHQQGEDATDSLACATDQCVHDDEAVIILAFLANLESDQFPPLMVIASAHDVDLLAEAGASPACDKAILADARASSVLKEKPTISHNSNADDDVEVLSTFEADECAEVGSTITSQNFLVAEYAVISSFLAALHKLPVHVNLDPSVETSALLHHP
ncbi:hypothetical protein KP509_36G034300 [Ceratopteris richardii]|uniref:Uncharacterized protein n=1 Tax=Ceratopteris richardii TaxID=49495 RepID=A0A8T2QAR1_CERRI|nr:hypothetical protein KP509_36G034300 [Ceratopteris richardii]